MFNSCRVGLVTAASSSQGEPAQLVRQCHAFNGERGGGGLLQRTVAFGHEFAHDLPHCGHAVREPGAHLVGFGSGGAIGSLRDDCGCAEDFLGRLDGTPTGRAELNRIAISFIRHHGRAHVVADEIGMYLTTRLNLWAALQIADDRPARVGSRASAEI